MNVFEDSEYVPLNRDLCVYEKNRGAYSNFTGNSNKEVQTTIHKFVSSNLCKNCNDEKGDHVKGTA